MTDLFIPDDLKEDIALPAAVAKVLDTSEDGLAQLRARNRGPKYTRHDRRILYRWSDIRAYLNENTVEADR